MGVKPAPKFCGVPVPRIPLRTSECIDCGTLIVNEGPHGPLATRCQEHKRLAHRSAGQRYEQRWRVAMRSTLDLSADDLAVLAEYGHHYAHVSVPPPEVGCGASNLCFNNTSLFVAANPGWTYVEGKATRDQVRAHHAWASRGDVALELTWPAPGSDYVGVPLGDGPRFIPGLLGCYPATSSNVPDILARWAKLRTSPEPRRPVGPFGWDGLHRAQERNTPSTPPKEI